MYMHVCLCLYVYAQIRMLKAQRVSAGGSDWEREPVSRNSEAAAQYSASLGMLVWVWVWVWVGV